MKSIEHQVKHYFQPTNNTCGYAALATILSFYKFKIKPEEIIKTIPVRKDKSGTEFGSITPQLAAWCMNEYGIKSQIYSFDNLVLDISWGKLDNKSLVYKLRDFIGKRDAQIFSRFWADNYLKAYIEFLEAGGKLTIQPFVTTALLYELLKSGPVFTNICSTTLRGEGRRRNTGLRKSVLDDSDRVLNHSVVIYGHDETGNFLVADPWVGRITVSPELMAVVITASQIECDNMCLIFIK